MTEELMKLRKHRDALEAFIKGPAHAGFVAARQEELRLVERTILDIDPIRHEDEVEQYKLRGEKRLLEGLLDVFPDALEELKDRISDLEDEEIRPAGEARSGGERTTSKRGQVNEIS